MAFDKSSPEPIRIVPGLGEWLIGNEPCAIDTYCQVIESKL